MSGKRYTEEFKIAAVKQVAQRGHPASEVAERLGVSIHSLYAWTKRYGVPEAERKAVDAQVDEMRRLKAELDAGARFGERTNARSTKLLWSSAVAALEGVNIAITLDIFGQPHSVPRSGGGKSARRS